MLVDTVQLNDMTESQYGYFKKQFELITFMDAQCYNTKHEYSRYLPALTTLPPQHFLLNYSDETTEMFFQHPTYNYKSIYS